MNEETIIYGLGMLNTIRKVYGQESDVYSECCNFFEELYNNSLHNNHKVLYNPVLKTHEIGVK